MTYLDDAHALPLALLNQDRPSWRLRHCLNPWFLGQSARRVPSLRFDPPLVKGNANAGGVLKEKLGQPIMLFRTLEDFERWLSSQPPAAGGVWLRFAKKGAPLVTLSKQAAIDAALCHGWIDGQLQTFDAESWLIRFTPRNARSKWSQVNRDRAQVLVGEGRMRAAGLAQIQRAQADGRWEAAYAPQSRGVVPPDLQAALDGNPTAKAFFATLDAANRYAITYRVQDAKKPETRAARIRKYVGMLARGATIHPKPRGVS